MPAGRIRTSPLAPTPLPLAGIRIDAQRSKGITNIRVFCLDLMLAELAARCGIGPGFLIHDDHLFDDVDERQVAEAFQLGADHAASFGFRYIVTMNSDALSRNSFRADFDIDAFVRPIRLTHVTGKEGSFVLRFN